MQLSVNRRRSSDGLSFGAAYTYQMVNKTLGAIDPFVTDNRAQELQLGHDGNDGGRQHIADDQLLVRGAEPEPRWNNVVAKAIFDNWQVSGVTSILSGTRQGFTYGYTNVPTGVLSGTGRDQRRRQPRRHRVRPDTCRAASAPSSGSSGRSASGRPTDPFRLGTSLGDEYHRTGLHELGHLGVQERADGRGPAAAVPRRALQRVQHGPVDRRRSTRAPCSTTRPVR